MADISAASRVDWALDEWARYMRFDAHRLNYRSGVAVIGVSHSSDFDALADAADRESVKATDAVIRDLPQIEQLALQHVHIAAVIRFKREPVEAIYGRARDGVEAGLRRKGML